MTEYKFKVGDKVKQNGKGIPYDQNKGLVGTVTLVNYGRDRGDYAVNQVWVDFGAMQPSYYRDFELDLVEAKKVDSDMSEYVTTTTEVIPAQTKVTKTINKVIDADGPGFSNLSVVPDGKTLVDIVVGAGWYDRSASSFSKSTLGELIEILKEVHEAMESF